MKFLITGGAGFIGSHIAEELVKAKKGEVVCFDNLSVGTKDNVPKGARLIVGDVKDEKALTKAMQGVDIVFHDAAFVSIRGSYDLLKRELDDNCYGALNVFNACIKNKVKKIIFASSMAAYGKPLSLPFKEDHPLTAFSPYGLSKARGELYCNIFKEKGLNYTVLRYFNTFGTRQTPSPYVGVTTIFIKQALQGKPLTVYGSGNQTRDFVWVKDIAQANLLAAFSNKNGVYNVATGTETSINALADRICELTGAKKTYVKAPGGETDRNYADISKIRKELGYKPRKSLLEYLPELIKHWKQKL